MSIAPQNKTLPRGKTAKLVTYSMDLTTLSRMDKLLLWRHETNKSRLICRLLDQEYFRLAHERGEDE